MSDLPITNNVHRITKTTSDPIIDFGKIIIPDTVTSVIASGIGLKSLYGLRECIVNLDVSDNELVDLKFCPKSIRNLRASKNKITSLRGIEDTKITSLGISYNHLTNFEAAPVTLTSVVCVSNFLTTLKGLPPKMIKLYASYNKLKNANYCPIANILDLSCNLIESFDGIQEGTLELIISNNPFRNISLKTLPYTIKLLRCSSCDVTSLDGYPRDMKLLECLKSNIQDYSDIKSRKDIEIFTDSYTTANSL